MPNLSANRVTWKRIVVPDDVGQQSPLGHYHSYRPYLTE